MKANPLRGMQTDFLAFVGLRLLSGVLSFTLFALVARWFPIAQTKPLYFYLFVAGFFFSALRALASISASLQGNETRTVKLRRTCTAYAQVLCAAMIMVPLILWVLSGLGAPVWAGAALVVVLFCWGLDADIVRAIVGRRSAVAVVAVVGATSALVSLFTFRTFEAAFGAILLQWLPLCLLNGYLLYRLRVRVLRALRSMFIARGRGLMWMLGVAIFDGVILNTPFFLASQTPPTVAHSTAIAIRIYVAALILMPLIAYWSNGQSLNHLATRWRVGTATLYWGISLCSGLIAGAVFALAFAYIAATQPSPPKLLAAAVMLLGYNSYAATGRYRADTSASLMPWLVGLAILNLLLILGVLKLGMGVLGIATVQSSSLLAASLLLAFSRPCRE